MSLEHQRWDPNTPGFLVVVLRCMIGLWVGVVLVGGIIYRAGISGFISGGSLAIALYVIAMLAGRVFIHTRKFSRVMLWLFLSQFLLWVGMAVLLAVVKVHPIGFVVGASILPASIIVALGWYAIQRRRLPS